MPEVHPELSGQAPAGMWAAAAASVSAEGYTLERGPCDGANGYVQSETRTVRVRDDIDEAQAVKTLVHELAHLYLNTGPEFDYARNREVAEVEAESVAYVVAAASGRDTTRYSTPYLAGWAGGDVEPVRAAADRVIATAARILDRLQPAPAIGEEA